MEGHLITVDGEVEVPTVETVKALLESGARFWLDLIDPGPEEQDAFLRDTFGFHPLALEDAANFGQRPKLDIYDDFVMLVVYGVNHHNHLVEVHCFYTDKYLVTVHQDHCPALSALVPRLTARGHEDHVMLLYRVIDTLVDGYFPVLSAMDDQIDELEDAILERPTEQQLGTLFDLKRSLIALRKIVTPQRDMFSSVLSEPGVVPGMTTDSERYFRDLYDHLMRISELVDSYRDLMSGALDTHLSTVSNRLNVVMKQLTIIATVFLPVTYLTGFFGQNFGWLTGHINATATFFLLGVALQVALVGGLMWFFHRRGWLTADASVPPSEPGRRRRVLAKEHRWKLIHTGEKSSSIPAGTAAPSAELL
jgi:magnesium transporter